MHEWRNVDFRFWQIELPNGWKASVSEVNEGGKFTAAATGPNGEGRGSPDRRDFEDAKHAAMKFAGYAPEDSA